MSSKVTFFLTAALFTGTLAHAETIKSGSDYVIIVEVYKGTNKTCNAKEGELTSAVTGVSESSEKTKGSAIEKFGAAVSQAINTAMMGSGCEHVGKAVTLNPGQSLNMPVDSILVAYKDPVDAWVYKNKVVNPLPALCKVQSNKTMTFNTRKSGILKKLTGFAGDGGLKCDIS